MVLVLGFEVPLEKTPEEKRVDLQFNILKKRLEAVGMDTGICMPGQYNHLLCPEVSLFFLHSLMLFEEAFHVGLVYCDVLMLWKVLQYF